MVVTKPNISDGLYNAQKGEDDRKLSRDVYTTEYNNS